MNLFGVKGHDRKLDEIRKLLIIFIKFFVSDSTDGRQISRVWGPKNAYIVFALFDVIDQYCTGHSPADVVYAAGQNKVNTG